MQRTRVKPEQVAEELMQLMNASMKAAQSDLFALVETLGVSLSQFKMMHLLEHAGEERTPSQLARTIGLSPGATSRAADALARQGILIRRDDPEDRRVKWLSLTDTGRKALSQINAARRDALARLVATLDDEQRAALSDAIAPLLENAQDFEPEGARSAEKSK